MSTATGALTVTRSAVIQGGQTVVARLYYSGRVITVRRTADSKVIGRLLPLGYAQGRPDDGSGRYDAWTAKHPSVHVPSDRPLAYGLTLAEGVRFLLDY